MKFRTEVNLTPGAHPLTHSSEIVMLGSCFSDSIVRLLEMRLFNVVSNPLGTLYNPASIADVIERIVRKRPFTADDLFERDGIYHCFSCHSSLAMADRDAMVARLNRIVEDSHRRLISATDLFLTFGTAWVFRLKTTGRVVANCHKQPAAMFDRSMMSVDESAAHIARAISLVRELNPDIAVTLTVSPIRHLADGAHGNTLSKSTLQLAVAAVGTSHPAVDYFPSYEILLDDLRDYRFYDRDLCHPAEMAVDYIFEKFADRYLNPATQQLSEQCLKLMRRLKHRFINADSDASRQFADTTRAMAARLVESYPELTDRIGNLL